MSDNSIIKQTKLNIEKLVPEIAKAQEAIDLLNDAGEDASKQEAILRQLNIRLGKWKRALEARGEVFES